MTLQIKAPPHKREGAGVGVPPPTVKTSGVSIAEKLSVNKTPQTFDGHRFVCFFRQTPVYGKQAHLYSLREGILVAFTSEELDALAHSRLPYCFPKLQAALVVEELEAVV